MPPIENPWLDLSDSGPNYVLPIDEECVRYHNGILSSAVTRVVTRSIPEPFIGDPEKARVVLLGKNPGHSSQNEIDYRDPEFRRALFRNLRQEQMDFPFYPLNPAFKDTGAGNWWRKRTQKLREEAGLEERVFAERLMVIEWFPYHSTRFRMPRFACKSQEFSFQLAMEMLETKLVVGIRAKRLWAAVNPKSGNIPYLRNPQSAHVSRANTKPGLFDEILIALKAAP